MQVEHDVAYFAGHPGIAAEHPAIGNDSSSTSKIALKQDEIFDADRGPPHHLGKFWRLRAGSSKPGLSAPMPL